MTRLRWLLALPALLIATSGPLNASEIKDRVGLFSPDAVKKALSDLDRVEKQYAVPVTIETIESLKGDLISDLTTSHAQQAGAKGIYILIAKAESKIFGEASKQYRTALTRERLKTIDDAFIEQFKKKDFDAGLSRGVSQIESTVAEARPAAKARRAGTGPVVQPPVAGKPSSGGLNMLLTIGLGLLAVFIVIRILGALFSGGNRGYAGQNRQMGPGAGMGGGPGYGGGGGGGGGGFMSSMFGGIGGALAGNWLYDQFSGRHHDTSMGQSSNYDPAAGAAPVDSGPEWGGGGAEGDWGGGGAADAGGAGGDWGGGGADAGGGGDWGGGGGGGDWGGGGGDAGGGGDGGGW